MTEKAEVSAALKMFETRGLGPETIELLRQMVESGVSDGPKESKAFEIVNTSVVTPALNRPL